jgi:hypothetical protein
MNVIKLYRWGLHSIRNYPNQHPEIVHSDHYTGAELTYKTQKSIPVGLSQ